MKFEYIGFKPQISQHGVSFKQGKDDKYIYLPYVYEILEAINSDYNTNKNHSSSIKIDNSNISKLYSKVIEQYPNLKQEIEDNVAKFKNFLENQKQEIKESNILNELDKSAYLTNLDLMQDYQLKRAKNKIFYYYSVYTVSNIIKENKIKEIDLPFNEKFWHVLKTLQGVLSREKINSDIKALYTDTTLRIKLTTSL